VNDFRVLSNFDQIAAKVLLSFSPSRSGERESVMCLLMIRCPRTGQEVWTGVETDPDSFRKIPDDLFYTSCPHCGLEHAWWRDEAWLVDGPGAAKHLGASGLVTEQGAILNARILC